MQYFNQQFVMLEHSVKVSVRQRFETKIAESSKSAKKLWETSNLEIAKVGCISTKQKNRSLSTAIGRTKAGVKYKNRVFLYSCYMEFFIEFRRSSMAKSRYFLRQKSLCLIVQKP